MTYDPWHSRVPYQEGEVEEARDRPHSRPHPVVGDHVLYRHYPHGDAVDAVVTEVQDMHEGGDPNLLFPDPWITLEMHTIHGVVKSRQSRMRGSAGWLHIEDMFQ
jgi:hypothetical protein